MTLREKEIFSMIKTDPLISQQEIADRLGLKRSSVAVHILNLTKKGLIKGKGYIINEGEYVLVIGGANVDILGAPSAPVVLNDSNPGSVRTSPGGVGRNIAENLSILGVNTRFISAVGDDENGRRIIEEGIKSGIDMSRVSIIKDESTSVYLSLLDDKGDMLVALSDMEIVRKIDVRLIKSYSDLIKNASVVVFDANLEQDVIDYMLTEFKDAVFFADTVSTAKTGKLKNNIGRLSCLKPNRKEAEVLTGLKIKEEADFYKAAEALLNKGVRQVFITAGEAGVYYGSKQEFGHFRMTAGQIVNANGAGDMFTAAVVYSYLQGYSIERSARFASCASIMSMKSIDTINKDLSVKKIESELNQLETDRSK